MNRTGALYRLIRSMSQSEKRYFSLFATSPRESSDYLRLFKVIDEEKIYDDETLKRALDAESPMKHFAVKKIQLYQLLLKSLRNFHEGRSFDFTLKEMMLNAAILSDKALYHDCYTVLEKAKVIAWQYEEWKVLLEILHKEYTIIQHIAEPRNLEKEILRFNNEEKKIIAQLNNYGEFAYLNMALRIRIQRAEKGDSRAMKKTLDKLMSQKLLANEKSAISFRSKSLYYLIRSTHFLHSMQYEKAELLLTRHRSMYEGNLHFISASPGNYLNTLHELMLVHFRMQRFDQALKIIAHLRQLPAVSNIRKVRSSRFKIVLLSWTLRIELAIAMKTGTIKKVLNDLKEEEEFFQRHAGLMDSQKRNETYLALASGYFQLEDHNKTIHFIQQILRDPRSERLRETGFMTRVLQVIIHFEDNDTDLLEYLIASLKRMYAKRKPQSETEKLMLEFISRIPRFDGSHKHRAIISPYLKRFESLKEKRSEQPWYDYFDITPWIKRKI